MILTENEILSTLILNNKDKLIDRVPALTDEQKQQAKDFFKKYSNYENKIDWNKLKSLTWKDFEEVFELASQSKSAKKANVRGLFADKENFIIVNEDDNFIYASPLDYEGGKFCDSYDCGGAGAKWCIGWTQDSRYWNGYTRDGDVFCMIMTKPNAQVSLYDMFSGKTGKTKEVTLDEEALNLSDRSYTDSNIISPIRTAIRDTKNPLLMIVNLRNMDETDNKAMCQIHSNGQVEVWSQVKDARILENRTVEEINSLGFNIPTDVYETVRPEVERLKKEKLGNVDIESEYGRAVQQFLVEEFGEATDVQQLYHHEHSWSGNNMEWDVYTDEEADDEWERCLRENAEGYPRETMGTDFVIEEPFEDFYNKNLEYLWDESMSDMDKVVWLVARSEFVDKTEQWFEVDSNENLDFTKPKFDVEKYRDEFMIVKKDSFDGYRYASKWYLDTYGEEAFEEFVEENNAYDIDGYIRDQMRWSSRGEGIYHYDDEEHEVTTDDGTFYIYRTN